MNGSIAVIRFVPCHLSNMRQCITNPSASVQLKQKQHLGQHVRCLADSVECKPDVIPATDFCTHA